MKYKMLCQKSKESCDTPARTTARPTGSSGRDIVQSGGKDHKADTKFNKEKITFILKNSTVQYKEALTRTQAICSRQEKCKKDILEKLSRWGVSEEKAEQIIKQLEKEGFLDEARYAGNYARDKFKFNKWGRIKITYMLKQKQIPATVITDALSSIPEEEYLLVLKQELGKKRRSIKSKNQYDIKSKLIQFGHQRGFEFEVIVRILEEL